jgi:hypothetical protein
MIAQSSTPVAGPTSTGASGTTTAQGPTINGVPPQTRTTPTAPTAAPTTPTATQHTGAATISQATIEQIVAVTRAVDPGTTAVNAFTVPAGRLLVITDLLITNPGEAPACGTSISSGGAGSPGPPAASDTGRGCVPAQGSLNVGFTTGLEFAAGQSVLLSNIATQQTTSAPLHYHLCGFLVTGI